MNPGGREPSTSFCVFRSGHGCYALPTLAVREVEIAPPLTPLPRSPETILGLCHLRNEFLPVVSFQRATASTECIDDNESTLLVVEGREGAWGLMVNRVSGLEELDVAPTPAADAADSWEAVVAGWASLGEQSVQILDPHTFYRWVTAAIDAAWHDETTSSPVVTQAKPTAGVGSGGNLRRMNQ